MVLGGPHDVRGVKSLADGAVGAVLAQQAEVSTVVSRTVWLRFPLVQCDINIYIRGLTEKAA